MKKAIPLILLATSLASCSQHISVQSDDFKKPIAISYSKKQISPKDSLITPKKTWENDVFLIGWKVSENFGYDISLLTQEERMAVIENGIKVLTNDADTKEHEKTNRAILANYYYAQKDFKKAVYWAFKGVDSGSVSCMYILANAYINGDKALVQDFQEGLKWVYLAAACGDKSCKEIVAENHINFLFDKDSRKIILSSQNKATEWMKEHSDLFASPMNMDERIL